MSSLINAWTIAGAAVGGVGSVVNGVLNMEFDSNKSVLSLGKSLVWIFLGGCIGMGAESVYHRWAEPTPITAESCASAAPKNSNYEFKVVNGAATCSYSPK